MSKNTSKYLQAEINSEKTKLKREVSEENEAIGPSRLKNLHEVIRTTKSKEYYYNRNFYLVLVLTNEKTPGNLPVDHIFTRRSCPSPGYNQNVFKYHHISGSLEYLWTIPRQHIYWHMYKNKSYYLQSEKHKRMMSFIVLMESGELLKWCIKENGELPDAIISLNKPQTLQA
jgi:hypothetical protein